MRQSTKNGQLPDIWKLFIRPVDWDHSHVNPDGGYQGQYLYAGESCLIIATQVPTGLAAPLRPCWVTRTEPADR